MEVPFTFTKKLAVAALGTVAALSWLTGPAPAQTVGAGQDELVAVPASQLEKIQQELQYLRSRDAELQAWQDSLDNRLSTSVFEQASQRRLFQDPVESSPSDVPTGDIEMPLLVDESYALGGCGDLPGSCCCSCYPCQCPLPAAPCIECPHVSTLNPYFNLRIFGALKMDMLFNTARPISPGTPFFLTPDSVLGFNQGTVSMHARQSTIGAALAGPQMGSFQSGGTLLAMFFNDNVIADQYGFLPLQAYGELRNEDWRFAAGLQFDVFSPGIPTVLPFSALAGSGNAGNSFRGQVRLERFLYPANDMQWTLQMALSNPINTTIDPRFLLNEDNGWPNVEGRIALALGLPQGPLAQRPVEVGVSGVVGQIRTTAAPPVGRVVADVWGLATDFRWQVNKGFGFQGELYTGQSLGTYNGGILQNTNADTLLGMRSSGGWLETYYYLTPCLHSHIGYGIDNPIDRDVADTAAALGRVENSTIFTNLLWDVNQAFRVGFEFTYRETHYKNPLLPDNEGAGFHTQFQWAF